MYSILLKLTNTTADRYKYLTDDNDEIYVADTLAEVEAKVQELLNDYLLSNIKVIKNCIITSTITVEEVEID